MKAVCNYQGAHFGAQYPDAVCIDGYLWDLDSGGIDDEGNSYLDAGGEMPCPSCNSKRYVLSQADGFLNDGYESLDHPLTTKMVKTVMDSLPSNQRRVALRYWRKGRVQAIKEAKQMGG